MCSQVGGALSEKNLKVAKNTHALTLKCDFFFSVNLEIIWSSTSVLYAFIRCETAQTSRTDNTENIRDIFRGVQCLFLSIKEMN